MASGYVTAFVGRTRLRKWQFGSDSRSLAVIYPVSIDPDGFRRTTPNH
jgi:hypothetical protein